MICLLRCSGLSDVRDHVHASVGVRHRDVLKHVRAVAIVHVLVSGTICS